VNYGEKAEVVKTVKSNLPRLNGVAVFVIENRPEEIEPPTASAS
jgi:hypothetical protein